MRRPVTIQIGELSGDDFVSLTVEQRADDAVREVWRTYDAARIKILAYDPDRIVASTASVFSPVIGAAAWLASWASGSGEARTSARDAITSLKPFIESWAGERRTWANMGRSSAGVTYTWDDWSAEGAAYLSAINEIYDIGSDYSLLQNIGNAASDTVDDVKKKAKDTADTVALWMKLTVVGVVLIGAAYAYNTFGPDVRRGYDAAKAKVRRALPARSSGVAGLKKRKTRKARRRR